MRDYKFGTRIYNLRKGKGWSQEELGNLIGVSNKAVSKWETGEAKPAVNQLMKLSKVFEVSIDISSRSLTLSFDMSIPTIVVFVSRMFF